MGSTAQSSRAASHRPDAVDGSTGAAAHAHPNRAVGLPQVLDQGLAGLVLQLLKSGCADANGQGHSCGEGCAYGLGFQVTGALNLKAEHDFTHAGYLLRSGSILGLLRRERRYGRIRGTGPAGT